MRKDNRFSGLFIAILVTAVVAGGGVYLWMGGELPTAKAPAEEEVMEKTEPTLYENENFGFSLEIPADWGEMEVVTEHPEDPGPPADGGLIMVPAEKIIFTAKENSRKSFDVNIYDLTKDYMALGDGATGQTVVYIDENLGIDIWLNDGSEEFFKCNYDIDLHAIPKEICDEANRIVEQINDEIVSSFKIEKDEPVKTLTPSLDSIEDFNTYVPYNGSFIIPPDGCSVHADYLDRVASGEIQADENYDEAMEGVDWEKFAELSQSIHSGEIRQKVFYQNEDMDLKLSLYLTPRYGLAEEEIEEMGRCVDGVGYLQLYKLYEADILWADLDCAGGAGPSERLKPGITKAIEDCEIVRDELVKMRENL
jgi:hypothetical protein